MVRCGTANTAKRPRMKPLAEFNPINNQSGQAQHPPLSLRLLSLVPATTALRAFVTSTLPSSAQQTFPSVVPPAVKDCFGLHSNSAFGSVAFPGRRWVGKWNHVKPAAINVSASVRSWYSGWCQEKKSGVSQQSLLPQVQLADLSHLPRAARLATCFLRCAP